MKLLWIVNNIMPKLAEKTGLKASASGSWLIDISNQLSQKEDIKLAIAAIGGRQFSKYEIDNVTYYLLPGTGKNMLFYTKKYEKLWREVNNEFQPDIVHLYGTEYTHGLSFLRANPHVRAIVSVQGIISRIKDVMFDGLPRRFDLKYATLKECIKMKGLYPRYCLYKKNSKYEREILNRVKYASVVNSWDYAVAKNINPDLEFFPLEYNLRNTFYDAKKWDVEQVNRMQIFAAPGGDPIKGLHILLKAIAIVKRSYNNIKLVVPGINASRGEIVVDGGYKKYLRKLIKKLDIKDNVEFVGCLKEEQMVQSMQRSHMVVIPSAIEGTSLVLREAMYLGVPCIASFRGGMADFIADKEDGFLYDFPEYSYLALRIQTLLENDTLAKQFSQKGVIKAENAHNRERNVENNIQMYKKIFDEVNNGEMC